MSHSVPSPETPDPRYPIGRFVPPDSISRDDLDYAIEEIALLPERLRNSVFHLDEEQLDTPYRDGGWTVRQLVHHVADSHTNLHLRLRLALTADNPVILPYNEALWAELHDACTAPVEWSLDLLEALHARWAMLLQHLSTQQWKRTFVHPETGAWTIEQATLLYAWHSRHHTAHVTHLRSARGW